MNYKEFKEEKDILNEEYGKLFGKLKLETSKKFENLKREHHQKLDILTKMFRKSIESETAKTVKKVKHVC